MAPIITEETRHPVAQLVRWQTKMGARRWQPSCEGSRFANRPHYCDVIMTAMESQITTPQPFHVLCRGSWLTKSFSFPYEGHWSVIMINQPRLTWKIIDITVTSWARWRLKSPASRLFTQPFVLAQIKENIQTPRHWPLWEEPPVTGGFPSQRISNAQNISISWRHHDDYIW